MLIIIEGPDKTGKTTLAKAIAAKLKFKYVHFSKPKGRAADEYIDFLTNLKGDAVCDRFHLGEFVYSKIFKRECGINAKELETMERMMRDKQTILIHAVTNMGLANVRLKNSKDYEVVDMRQNLLAAKGFAKVFPHTKAGPIIKYDGSSLSEISRIVALIKAVKKTISRS